MSRGNRKIRIGRVVNDGMDKTVMVLVEWRQKHPLYKKSVRRFTKLVAHDEKNESSIGDQVSIIETRPMSKTKRWRVSEIIQRREVAEIKPVEVDETLEYELRGEIPAQDDVTASPEAETADEPEDEVSGAETEETPAAQDDQEENEKELGK